MVLPAEPPAFRNEDRPVVALKRFSSAEDILEAMLQSVQGGELHTRPALSPDEANPAHNFLEVGHALRRCLEDKEKQDYLLQRLRPHLSVLIGTLPASLKKNGLLPRLTPEQQTARGYRQLEDISAEEVRQWLVVEGGLIYGELKRHELENYFDFVAPLLRPGAKMVDLGSGLGKVVMSAALSLPLARCVGVEILAYRHRLALDRLQKMLAVRDRGVKLLRPPLRPDQVLHLPTGATTDARHLLDLAARVEFFEQSMFDVDLRDSDLVFIYSTCFAPLMPAIAEKLARDLPENALVSTTSVPLRHPDFRLLKHFPGKTMAWTDVFFYQRIRSAEAAPAPDATTLYQPDGQAWEARARQELASLS